MPHLADYSDMSARPRVSVIVTAYNLAHYLPAALDSALAQESPGGPIQIIVVDDGSTDNTQEVLAAYADRVEVIRQENGGLVKAVDTGLSAVRGDYVALLDADDEWPHDRLRRHAEILDANPQVGLVHGDMEVIDADGNTLHPSFFTWKQDTPTNGRVLARLVKDNFVSGGASTFRASLMPAIWPIPLRRPTPTGGSPPTSRRSPRSSTTRPTPTAIATTAATWASARTAPRCWRSSAGSFPIGAGRCATSHRTRRSTCAP